MAQRSDIPFNITLLELTPNKLQNMRPVTKLDIFDGSSNLFNPDGLFSTLIFGKEGDDRRLFRFSFIDIKIPIFHPIIYEAVVKLKRLYGGIINGTEYVTWNEELKNFERSNNLVGKTGFNFFLEHWENIEFEQTGSPLREQSILMINKYKKVALTPKVLVMPAGYRDVEIGPDGRPREDEINKLYRQLLTIANTISESAVKTNAEMLDRARYNLQLTFNEIYNTIKAMLEGKNKLLLGKWATRGLMNGTRNVITGMDTSVSYLGAPGTVGFNNTIVGLYQLLKSIMPVARYHIRHGFLSKVFTEVGAPAKLVNVNTLHCEEVALKPQYFDKWMTDEGIEKVLTSFSEEAIRHKPIIIEGHYLGLIYKGPDNTFKLIQDIDELPLERNKDDVHPLTFCELLYLSCYTELNKFPIFITRYPVTGVGSIYPSKAFVKTTTVSEVRSELNDQWEPMDAEHTAYEFPIKDGAFVNSTIPHSAKLSRLGADFK